MVTSTGCSTSQVVHYADNKQRDLNNGDDENQMATATMVTAIIKWREGGREGESNGTVIETLNTTIIHESKSDSDNKRESKNGYSDGENLIIKWQRIVTN